MWLFNPLLLLCLMTQMIWDNFRPQKGNIYTEKEDTIPLKEIKLYERGSASTYNLWWWHSRWTSFTSWMACHMIFPFFLVHLWAPFPEDLQQKFVHRSTICHPLRSSRLLLLLQVAPQWTPRGLYFQEIHKCYTSLRRLFKYWK